LHPAFPLYAIVSGHRKTLCKSRGFAAVADGALNQFCLVKGGPGIIALPGFLCIQSCGVAAFGVSPRRMDLTSLPLLLHGWFGSHQFAAFAVHGSIFWIGGARLSAAEVLCLKTSPPTREASGCCAARSLLFVPLPKKYTPTYEGISYTKCSAAFAKNPQFNPHPTPFVSPPPLLH
jgi:hypothetical protein